MAADDDMPRWAQAMEERLAGRISSLDERLSGRLDALTEGQDGLRATMVGRPEFETAVAGLRREFTGLRTAVMGKLEEVHDALTQRREESVVDFGAAERSERIAKSARAYAESVGEQVNALVRIVRRLETDVRELREGRGGGGGAPG